jgi:putative methionine-R-sulfoxide reductase with GAF domain
MNEWLNSLASQWQSSAVPAERWQKVFSWLLRDFAAETATVHRLDAATQTLHLVAHVGLPPALLPIVQTIPVGKGIAGETVVRNGPVTICNLQTDTSGVAKPGARQTGVGGALCVPIRRGDAIIGTLGVGTQRACEFTAAETARLESAATWLGERGAL